MIPQTLAEVAGLVARGESFDLCLRNFLDAFLAHPASTALAVWMGTALVGVKLVEILFLKGSYDVYQFFYMGLILIGIVGLKRMP